MMIARGGPQPIRLSTDRSEDVIQAAAQNGRAVLRAQQPLGEPIPVAVVAVDFSPASIDAARLVYRLVRERGVLFLVHVLPRREDDAFTLDYFRAREEQSMRQQFDELIRVLTVPGHHVRVVPVLRCGNVAEQVLEFSRSNQAALLGVGCCNRSRDWTRSHGITARILNGSRRPTIVVPPRRRVTMSGADATRQPHGSVSREQDN